MIQTSENDKRPNFGPDFGPFGPNLDSPYYAIQNRTNKSNLRK